jgi:maltose/moltooligosaccharide transporter
MTKPNLTNKQLWALSFGFMGVQIAFALQNANISRIFQTLGADPHNLSYFFIIPALMGMIIQPLVGKYSDRTWCRFGRRKPYLYVGALVATIVMLFLPNAGSLSMSFGLAMAFAISMLMLLDTSINMAMQPFKMMVGDMVNEQQKTKAYSIQSFWCNTGQLIGCLFPFVLTWLHISNEAPEGIIPDSVIFSFYAGAAILILCVIITSFSVKEMPPHEYDKYNTTQENGAEQNESMFSLLKKAPGNFWRIGLVQFFCWFAFTYMWAYTTAGIADTVWGTTDTKSAAFQDAGNWTGVIFAVQAVASILWAMVLPYFKGDKVAYSSSLILGAVGFVSLIYVNDIAVFFGVCPEYIKYLLFIPFILIGCAWAAMLAMPFSMLTKSLKSNIGTYLGLFNCTICIPQIVAGLFGGYILKAVGGASITMFFVAGGAMLLGALAVAGIRTKAE